MNIFYAVYDENSKLVLVTPRKDVVNALMQIHTIWSAIAIKTSSIGSAAYMASSIGPAEPYV